MKGLAPPTMPSHPRSSSSATASSRFTGFAMRMSLSTKRAAFIGGCGGVRAATPSPSVSGGAGIWRSSTGCSTRSSRVKYPLDAMASGHDERDRFPIEESARPPPLAMRRASAQPRQSVPRKRRHATAGRRTPRTTRQPQTAVASGFRRPSTLLRDGPDCRRAGPRGVAVIVGDTVVEAAGPSPSRSSGCSRGLVATDHGRRREATAASHPVSIARQPCDFEIALNSGAFDRLGFFDATRSGRGGLALSRRPAVQLRAAAFCGRGSFARYPRRPRSRLIGAAIFDRIRQPRRVHCG